MSCLPSYPYSEDSSQGKQYMNTRCPAWCDRVLMSPSAKELILRVSGTGRAEGTQGAGAGWGSRRAGSHFCVDPETSPHFGDHGAGVCVNSKHA